MSQGFGYPALSSHCIQACSKMGSDYERMGHKFEKILNDFFPKILEQLHLQQFNTTEYCKARNAMRLS